MFSTSKWGLEMFSSRLADGTREPVNVERPSPKAQVIRVGIIGTGNIGCDILLKLLVDFVSVVVFSGRRGVPRDQAAWEGILCSTGGIQFSWRTPTAATWCMTVQCRRREEHSKVFALQGIIVIDLCAQVGIMLCLA